MASPCLIGDMKARRGPGGQEPGGVSAVVPVPDDLCSSDVSGMIPMLALSDYNCA